MNRLSSPSSGYTRTVAIHTGVHKTGTTSLQSYFATRTRWPWGNAVLYPRSGRSPRYVPAHHNIAWEVSGDPRFTPRFGTIADLRRELAGHEGDVLMSSEDFTMAAFRPEAFADFVRALQGDGFRVVLVVFLRNQASHAVSMYMTLLGMGYDRDFRSFLDEMCDRGEVRYRQWIMPYGYDRYLESLQDLPAELRVRSYDVAARTDALLATFLDACGFESHGLGGGRLRRVHAAAAEWEAMRLFHRNAIGPLSPAVRRALSASERSLQRLRSYTEIERARLEDRFGGGNRVVRDRWGVELNPLTERDNSAEGKWASLTDLFSRDYHRSLAEVGSEQTRRGMLTSLASRPGDVVKSIRDRAVEWVRRRS